MAEICLKPVLCTSPTKKNGKFVPFWENKDGIAEYYIFIKSEL